MFKFLHINNEDASPTPHPSSVFAGWIWRRKPTQRILLLDGFATDPKHCHWRLLPSVFNNVLLKKTSPCRQSRTLPTSCKGASRHKNSLFKLLQKKRSRIIMSALIHCDLWTNDRAAVRENESTPATNQNRALVCGANKQSVLQGRREDLQCVFLSSDCLRWITGTYTQAWDKSQSLFLCLHIHPYPHTHAHTRNDSLFNHLSKQGTEGRYWHS